MQVEENKVNQFRSGACVVLGGFIGFFVGVPAASSLDPSIAPWITVAFVILGIASGYRRRASVGFFYFSLIVACVLASIVSLSTMNN